MGLIPGPGRSLEEAGVANPPSVPAWWACCLPMVNLAMTQHLSTMAACS